MRILVLCGLIALQLLRACDGWRDPYPGNVTLHTISGGRPVGCIAQLFNSDGKQLREDGVNDGLVHLTGLPAGTYTLRFRGHSGQAYPAVVTFQLYEAGELDLDIDLDKPPADGVIVNGGRPTE